ncbi:CHAT domain-containing protein [Pseudomonas fluorescens]|uniref:CHAT domain-containing protein n=1 Tax=Pseudomonas fluorescens TaxID=294 RepID=UPI0011322264|nr:CHAT domain-containing protein [Pseudomonas fluorescens]TMU79010.1 CHAT domain-containing protein [Pseudomonas fluorescens]
MPELTSHEELNLATRIFEEEHFQDIRFAFHYFIPHHRDYSRESFFLAYWPEIVESRRLLKLATTLPFDVREIKATRNNVAKARVTGVTSLVVIPTNIESMHGHYTTYAQPFKVILSDERMYRSVKDFLASEYGKGFLHISNAKSASREEKDSSLKKISTYAKERAVELLTKGQVPPEFVTAIEEVLSPKKKHWKRLTFPGYSHGITTANEVIAQSMELSVSSEGKLQPHKYHEYIPAVLRSVLSLWNYRKDQIEGAPFENLLCITVEPILWRLYKADIDTELFNDDKQPEKIIAGLRTYVKSVKRSEEYIRNLTGREIEHITDLASDPIGNYFVALHRRELETFNLSTSILGLTDLCPVLRIEPKINKIKGDLINLANCSRGNGPHINFKLNKLSNKLQTRMHSLVHEKYSSLTNDKLPEFSGISLVSDLPLEWLPLRGLPLTLRCDVSRIPATPGNASLNQLIKSRYTTVSLSDFKEILIIRSFSNTDKIKFTLEKTLKHWADRHPEYPKYKIVDVATADEFVNTVNAFNGALMIFDGHGTLNTNSDMGSIIIGGKELDVWQLQQQLNMPPIVLLSACDTIPVDGGHGSSANGMLTLGATTVLGTLLPVDANRSASFISRLLFRISKLLPNIVNHATYMPWRGFMSGMLRMTFCTELIENLIKETKIISTDDRSSIQLIANNAINSMSPDWYEQVLTEICHRSTQEQTTTLEMCKFWGSMVDSLKYVQLGRPEKIKLRSKNINEAASIIRSNFKANH